MRKRYNSNFKSKVAVEAIIGRKTMAELSSTFEVHRDQVQKWKKIALDGLPGLFAANKGGVKDEQKLIDELYRQIGQLKVETSWLKKKV
jgi:transposase-like protein